MGVNAITSVTRRTLFLIFKNIFCFYTIGCERQSQSKDNNNIKYISSKKINNNNDYFFFQCQLVCAIQDCQLYIARNIVGSSQIIISLLYFLGNNFKIKTIANRTTASTKSMHIQNTTNCTVLLLTFIL